MGVNSLSMFLKGARVLADSEQPVSVDQTHTQRTMMLIQAAGSVLGVLSGLFAATVYRKSFRRETLTLVCLSWLSLQDGCDGLCAAVGPGEEQDAAERPGDEGPGV